MGHVFSVRTRLGAPTTGYSGVDSHPSTCLTNDNDKMEPRGIFALEQLHDGMLLSPTLKRSRPETKGTASWPNSPREKAGLQARGKGIGP